MIRNCFKSRRPLFIPFIMAGCPTLEITLEALIALAEVGSDIIELGVPFSDPVADGEVNQRAAECALAQGTTLPHIFNLVQRFRAKGYKTPIILFSYFNPLLAFGLQECASAAQTSGINGLLIIDLPAEEQEEYAFILKDSQLEVILLASPTTDPKRLPTYEALKPAFIYYISRLSVTGTHTVLPLHLKSEVESLKVKLPHTPILVGFGISNVEQAETVAQFSDGVIVGSLLVRTLLEKGIEPFKQLAFALAKSIHQKSC